MAIEIYIISGFLGAGKTTFIQKLLKEAFIGDKAVLIENDFGEISVDAALMRAGGITVRELNSGCICCTLSGDFIKSLKEVAERFHPKIIIIEPSGVGKLSDIVNACEDKRLGGLFAVKRKITVADAGRCRMYSDNFGEFFEDQIEHADAIVLSRTEDEGKTEKARSLMKELNPIAPIFSVSWGSLDIGGVLSLATQTHEALHSHDDCCGHEHSADETFDTVTIRTDEIFEIEELSSRMNRTNRNVSGTVLRAKGIVRGKNGYLEIQYVPDDLKIKAAEASGSMICFIGKDLDKKELTALFNGK